MFGTTVKRQAIALTVIALLVMILVAATAFGRIPTTSDRADTAWSQRLTGQAAVEHAARAAATWSARLQAQAQADPAAQAAAVADHAAQVKRANDAYSLRLTKLAEYELSKAR